MKTGSHRPVKVSRDRPRAASRRTLPERRVHPRETKPRDERLKRAKIEAENALSRAEEARRHLVETTVAGPDPQAEVLHRRAVEAALQKSQERTNRLLASARRMQRQLRHLSHRILQAQEEERKRVSRELHDEISQTLTGILVHLAGLAKERSLRSGAFREQLARTQRLVEDAVGSVHRFARELRPAMLDDLGLIPALHAYLKDFNQRTGLRIDFVAIPCVRAKRLDNVQLTALYRVAQEALTNVARHAQASRVSVSLRPAAGALRLEIRDNGKSFEVDPTSRDEHHARLGLLGMRERMAMAGGRLSIVSAPGQGTTIQAEIPLRGKDSARIRPRPGSV